MHLFYWHAPDGNFGDDLNGWFWDELLPGWRDWTHSGSLIGVGSLLTTNLALPSGIKIVAGAGAGYGQPPALGPDWDIRFVRGPRTAAALGLPISAGITDVAALCARLPRFAARPATVRRPLLVPHHLSDLRPDYDWPAIAAAANMDYVSPRDDAPTVIKAIAAAPLVLAESLHAAIISDAFRVPWRPVRAWDRGFNVFKWQDWTDSIEVPLEVTDLFDLLAPLRRMVPQVARKGLRTEPSSAGVARAPSLMSRIKKRVRTEVRTEVAAGALARAAKRTPFLSAGSVLNDRLDQMQAAMRKIDQDYGATRIAV